MQEFINALNKCILDKNWYGSLLIGLSLPDICGKFQFHTQSSTQRYSNWFDANLANKYSRPVGPSAEIHEFLSGADCYALRCAYLHEGSDDISTQRAREALSKFVFVAPPESGLIHLNQSNDKLQLQVDIFSKDIADAVQNWFNNLTDVRKQEINSQFAKIYSVDEGFSF